MATPTTGPHGQFHTDALPVVGQVIAGRSWHAYSDGALTGVTYGHEWTPGRNTAVCPYIGNAGHKRTFSDYGIPEPDPRIPKDWRNHEGATLYPHGKELNTRHKPGAMGCSCGWWAYHDLTHSSEWAHAYKFKPTVTGLVQLYGHMTRGSKGFRAQYADILAFVEPKWATDTEQRRGEPCSPAEMWERIATRYATVPVYPSIEAAASARKGHLT